MKKHLIPCLGALLLLGLACKDEPKQVDPGASPDLAVREWQPEDLRSMTGVTAPRGLVTDTDRDTDGYVLFEPSKSTQTYLLDKSGHVVHTWQSDLNSMSSYLLPDGRLIRLERDEDFPTFAAGGQAGRIREYSWDGELLWDYELATETELLHHDIAVMPNGNVLGISYEAITPEEAIELGRNPEHLPKAGLWLDKVVEIRPIRPSGGEIVWEWHMKDHLIQDFDASKANFGALADHPRRIDINFQSAEAGGGPPPTEEEIEQMKKNGMVTSNASVDNQGSDISHTNAINYNETLDQIVLSNPGLSEILIIDHSTTTDEARGTTGGRWGHGGELLYRWGNPQNYGQGTEEDRKLYFQHDAKWIPEGYPGAGRITVYNNDIPDHKSKFASAWEGLSTASPPDFAMKIGDVGNYSAVVELEPAVEANGAYMLDEDGRFGPEDPVWTYTAPDLYSFYSAFISGAHRLPNGHTFITQGMQGRFFEIDANKEIVWEYWMPYVHDYTLPDGSPAQPGGPFLFGTFRSTLVPADFEGLAGKSLEPIDPQPEVFQAPPPPGEGSERPDQPGGSANATN